MQENNIIKVSGELLGDIALSHKIHNDNFYACKIKIKRLSNNFDILPVTIPERLLKNLSGDNKFINIKGQIRSYNSYNHEEGRTKLILTIFAQEIKSCVNNNFDSQEKIYEENDCEQNPNLVYLNGYVCKPPIYRTTPFGREITDILLAVNRFYNKSDYIPCIAWGQNAKLASSLNVADNIKVYGRMQSRGYQKKTQTGEILEKTAYELSLSQIEINIKN